MSDEFLHAALGSTGRAVFRLGLSGSYNPGEAALRHGIDAGMNYLFWYYWQGQMARVLREVLPAWIVRRALDSCRRKLRTDYIDVLQIFWLGDGRLSDRTLDVLRRAKDEGKIRHIAVSTHARRYAAELVRAGKLDVLMMRYNAAHRGAEQDIFPHLAASRPGVVSYTATRWGKLLKRPRAWPASERIPAAGDCYRFVLTNPNVHVCLTAPRSARELEENLAAVARGPLSEEELSFMRRFGDVVHAQSRFF